MDTWCQTKEALVKEKREIPKFRLMKKKISTNKNFFKGKTEKIAFFNHYSKKFRSGNNY